MGYRIRSALPAGVGGIGRRAKLATWDPARAPTSVTRTGEVGASLGLRRLRRDEPPIFRAAMDVMGGHEAA